MRVQRVVALWIVPLLPLVSVVARGQEPSLVDAVKMGNVVAVRALIEGGTDVTQRDPHGTTALHWAVHRDDLELADLLLRHGARVDAANRYGVLPLYLASVNGNAAVVEKLLEAGADPDSALPSGETALMTAARTGDAATLKVLLAHGADVSAREGWKGQTALMWAAAENNAQAAALLIEARADINARSAGGVFTPFLFAVRGGHLEAARVLIDAGADVNATLPDGTNALVLAVINAHYELAGFLLDKGADPNAAAQGWTALHQISWTRRPNKGTNLPAPVLTGALDSLALVGKLVQAGAAVNARQTKEPQDGYRNMLNRIGATPFLLAAKAADVPLMRELLKHGADPTLTTVDGTTALMVAAGVGIWAPGESPGTAEEALAAVKLVFEVRGGDVNDVDADGNTALHGAVLRGGVIPLIELLVERGARLDVRNEKGRTPLTIADGVEYTPNIFRRYPEAAAVLRELMRRQGLPVPPPPAGVAPAAIGDRQ